MTFWSDWHLVFEEVLEWTREKEEKETKKGANAGR